MEIRKETEAIVGGVPTAAQMEAIAAQAKGKLTAEQVYVFSLRLCDDQVDRDGERFDTAALPELARLFIGKAGVIDHKWSAESQLARIFSTEVIQHDGCSFIKAWAYIRRGGRGDEWIADIEAGIKKEVSVGCAMASSVCSICGAPYGSCGHQKGEHYDGQLCCVILREPTDAYEFSFVAVPAQRQAGVLKGMGAGHVTLKELAVEFGAQEEYRMLSKLAQLGQSCAQSMRGEVVRLCLMLELGVEEPILRAMVERLNTEDLQVLRKALEQRAARLYPISPQLLSQTEHETLESGFLI